MSQKPEALTDIEIEDIKTAAQSVFRKLRNLYTEIAPIFDRYGFKSPGAGVVARDLSEKIETSIIQHTGSFEKGEGHSDLQRNGKRWEVKICKNSGLTINQSAIIEGENYIVINYKDDISINKIWVLWKAQDNFFSERKRNSNARAVRLKDAEANRQILFERKNETVKMQPQKSGTGVKKKRKKKVSNKTQPELFKQSI